MSQLEDELREALRRVEPPAGFTDRVLARIAEEKARPSWFDRLRSAFSMPQLRWAAAAAMLLVLVAGVQFERQSRRRAEGEQAKEQVLLALRITAKQIQVAQRGVRNLNTVR